MTHNKSNGHSHHHHGEELSHDHHHHHGEDSSHDHHHHHGEESSHEHHHHGEQQSNSDHHDHGDQRAHCQVQHSEVEMALSEKLALLLKHWIDHNNSHKDNYLSWADKADADKLAKTAEFLRETSALSVKITENLEKALKALHQ